MNIEVWAIFVLNFLHIGAEVGLISLITSLKNEKKVPERQRVHIGFSWIITRQGRTNRLVEAVHSARHELHRVETLHQCFYNGALIPRRKQARVRPRDYISPSLSAHWGSLLSEPTLRQHHSSLLCSRSNKEECVECFFIRKSRVWHRDAGGRSSAEACLETVQFGMSCFSARDMGNTKYH